MPSKSKPEPWERQEEEPAAAARWFRLYRDLGPGRSLEKLRQHFGETSAGMITKRALEMHSSAHDWVARARLYDEHLDRIRLGKAAEAAALWAARLAEDVEAGYQRGLAIRKIVDQAIKMPLVRRTVTESDPETGRPVAIAIEAVGWRLRDLVALDAYSWLLISEAHKAIGLDPAAMSDEELAAVAHAGGAAADGPRSSGGWPRGSTGI